MTPTEEEIAEATRLLKAELVAAASKVSKERMQPNAGAACPHYSVVGENLTDAIGAYIQTCLVCKKRRTVTEWGS